MFYDRKEERKALTDMLQNTVGQKAKMILLLGYSGVGKTGLMSELFSTTLQQKAHIHIHINKFFSGPIDSCHYFNRLYEELLNESKKKVTMNSISSDDPVASLRIRQLLRFAARWFASFIHIYEGETFIENKETADILQKRDFIVECLNKTPYIIDFQNIQNIDMQSLELLKDIVSRARQTTFVLEYTLSDQENSRYLDFYAEIKQFDAQIEPYRLEKLNETDALRLAASPVKTETERERLLKIYREKHGNLFQIICYNVQFPEDSDQIQEKVNSYVQNHENPSYLFILDLIYLNGGSISKESLLTLATSSGTGGQVSISRKDFAAVLKHLTAQKILDEKDGGFNIHDSVLSALEQQAHTPILYLAYNTLVRYYAAWKPASPQQQVYGLSQLFSLYLRFMDPQLLTILPDIRRTVISCKYPQAIYDALQKFIGLLRKRPNINENLYREVCVLLVEICIETGDSDTAWTILKSVPGLSNCEKRLLEARIYELGMGQEEIDSISALLQAAEEGSREALLLELSRLHVALRALPQSETCALVQRVIENAAYTQYPEYAFALSDQAELVDSPSKAVELYTKGIELLKVCGKEALGGCLYANICMSYGYMGELQKAKESLNQAKKSGIDEAVYLNNLTALDLLGKNVTEKSASNLEDALLLHANHFERLIIHNNLLIVQVLLRNWDQADAEYERLCGDGFEEFQYGEFLHMCYQNFLFYCEERGQEQMAGVYKEKLNELRLSPGTSEGTKTLIDAMLKQDRESGIFYAQYPYRAEFLCYWGIPPSMRG